MSKVADKLEEARAMLHSELQSRAVGRELTQLDVNNFLIEKLAEERIINHGLTAIVTSILKAMGGLKSEGDKQTDAKESTAGSLAPPTDAI